MPALQFDCWESPDHAQVAAAIAANPFLVAFQGYVPGWGAPDGGGWTAAGALAVMAQGLGYLPLLVPAGADPASTPQDAAGWDQAVQFADHHVRSAGGVLTVCGLDVEAGWSASYPAGWKAAAFAFALACERAGVASAVYGSPSFLSSLIGSAAHSIAYPGEWPNGASAPSPMPTSPDSIPGIPASAWTNPGQRIWQIQGGHRVAGFPYDVDLSITSSAVPYCHLVAQTPDPKPATPTTLAPGTYTLPTGATITIN